MKLTDAEWAVLEVLWSGEDFSLKAIADELKRIKGWSKNTVFTYLTRMEAKGLVAIDREKSAPYSAAISRADCAREERRQLLDRVYGGAAGDMIAAFLKESPISAQEVEALRKLLDEMEV